MTVPTSKVLMNRIKHTVHRLLQSCGCDLLRYAEGAFVAPRRVRILRTHEVSLVLDVGANEGGYPLALRESGYQGRIISFEPLADSFAVLQQQVRRDPLWTCHKLAIGDRDGKVEMNVSGHKTSSSILPISEVHLNAMPSSAAVRREAVEMARLDSLLEAIVKRDDRIYLKMDIQGFERQALDGAKEMLKQTRAIELELSMVPLYRGGAPLTEMVEYLYSIDYYLVSLEPAFQDPLTRELLQCDGIFVRRPLIPDGSSLHKTR